MQLSSALLCDAAKVRDALLYVIAGGITRIRRAEYPASVPLSVALVIDVHQSEMARPHELEIVLQGEDGRRLLAVKGGFQVSGADLVAGEHAFVPFALDFKGTLPAPGAYSIDIIIDGTHQRSLPFWAVQ